jgi:predicted amino acid-binding ACT domain protein
MPDSIRRADYYYVMAPDKPGEGARIFSALRDAGVNLLAVHAFPSARKSQIDLVPADAVSFLAAAKNAKLKLSKPKTVFLIEGDDRVGALASNLARLGSAGINVIAVSAVRTGTGRYGALLWVKPKDVLKAAETLGA